MITSANAGYLFDTTASCTVVNPGGFSRTFTKSNTIPAICTVISRCNPAGNIYKGLFLVSDNPEAVSYYVSDGITFGLNTNTYRDSNGTIWYSSVALYYMEYAGAYSGAYIDNSTTIYTDDEIASLVPVRDILKWAEPIVTADTPVKICPSNIILEDVGSVWNDGSATYLNHSYWTIFDGNISTYADYTNQNAKITLTYPRDVNITAIEYAPRNGYESRFASKVVEGLLSDGTWETIGTTSASPTGGQINSLTVSTGHTYKAIRTQIDNLSASVFRVVGNYTGGINEYKYYRMDISDARSWYANELCISDITFNNTNNTTAPIMSVSASYITDNKFVPDANDLVYNNSTTLSNLVDGNNNTECDVSWYKYHMLSLTFNVLVTVSVDNTYINGSSVSFNSTGRPLVNYAVNGNTGQSATPSTSNPAQYSGCGAYSNNLCNISNNNYLIYAGYDNFIISGDTIIISGVTCCGFKVKVQPNTPYTVSSTTSARMGIREYTAEPIDYDTNFISPQTVQTYDPSATFTTTSSTEWVLVEFYTNSATTVTDIMLNVGSTALTYEPYGTPIPITVLGGSNNSTPYSIKISKPIYKIGNVVDEINYDSNGVIRRIGKLMFTGNESWGSVTGSGTQRMISLSLTSSAVGFCSHFVSGSATNEGEYDFSSNTLRFNIYGIAETQSDWTTYLASQCSAGTPVTIWYVLTTPTVEKAILPQINADSGYNTLSVNTTLSPSRVSVDYISPTTVFDIGSYRYTTSNSDSSKDPVSWRLWVSNDNFYWNILDNITNATIPTARKTNTNLFTLTPATRETLTFIRSDGSQYINTKVCGSQLLDCEVNVQVYENYNGYCGIIGAEYNQSNNAMGISYRQSDGAVRFRYGNNQTESALSQPLSKNTPYKFEIMGNKLYLNNVEILSLSTPSLLYSQTYMTLFAVNRLQYTDIPVECGAYKIYGAKIWRNGTLLREFIPSRIKGVVGMYDTVTDSFFTGNCTHDFDTEANPSDTLFFIDGHCIANIGNIITSGKMRCDMEFLLTSLSGIQRLISNGTVYSQTYNSDDIEITNANNAKPNYALGTNVIYKTSMLFSANKSISNTYGYTINGNGVTIDNVSNFYLFGNSDNSNRLSAYICSCKIWDDQTLVFDLAVNYSVGGIIMYNDVDDTPITTIGEIAGPVWFMDSNDNLFNIMSPTPVAMDAPYPMEFWTFEGNNLINLLNPATIPTSTPPYPMMLWQEYDNVLYTNFSMENPLIGACSNTNNVETLVIPESVKYIGTYAFRNTNVSEVTIASDCQYSSTSFPNGCVIHFHGE